MKLLEKFDKEFLMAIGILLGCSIILVGITIIFIVSNNYHNSMSANYLDSLEDNDTNYSVFAQVLNDYVYLREEPNMNKDPLGVVNKNDIYLVIEIINNKENRWYKVQDSKGRMGYLSYAKGKYLDIFFGNKEEITLSSFARYTTTTTTMRTTTETTTTTTTTTFKTKKTKSTTLSKATAEPTSTTTTTSVNLTE